MKNKKTIYSGFILLLGLFVWSFFIETGLLTENNQIKNKWPYKSIKIAFFSDLHAGAPHINKKYIQNLVARINSHHPDLILIGGDLLINNVVGGKHMSIEDVSLILKDLKAPMGKFVVLGNHDWWNDAGHIKSVLNLNGFQVLENQNTLVQIDNNQKFWLIGIGDHFTNHSEPVKAFENTDKKFPKILFMHDPASLLDIKQDFYLALAGHMHGGQVFIPGIGALITPGDAPTSWAKGWTEFKYGSLYVSQGIGTSILPVRFNSMPEFVILYLQK